MKLAIFSESPADELSVRILIEGILRRPTELIQTAVQRPPGSTGVVVLPKVIDHLYYQTDADALVVVIDSDETPVHAPSHELSGGADPACRICGIGEVIKTAMQRLRPQAGRTPLYAIGTPVPAIEAWCLSPTNIHLTEAAWIRYQQTKQWPGFDRRSLKRDLYGTETPGRALETKLMSEAMKQVVTDLQALERRFPNGFGRLLRDVANW